MKYLCKIGIHKWIFGYRYNWVVAKKCDRCDKTIHFYKDEEKEDNTKIVYYDHRK